VKHQSCVSQDRNQEPFPVWRVVVWETTKVSPEKSDVEGGQLPVNWRKIAASGTPEPAVSFGFRFG
jgi:hypothetical protein